MAQKKTHPGGFRLTLAAARRLAVQEFGTAKGLEPDYGAMDQYERREKRAALARRVSDAGPDACHKQIDAARDRGR